MQLTISFEIKVIIKSTKFNGMNIRNEVGKNEEIYRQ